MTTERFRWLTDSQRVTWTAFAILAMFFCKYRLIYLFMSRVIWWVTTDELAQVCTTFLVANCKPHFFEKCKALSNYCDHLAQKSLGSNTNQPTNQPTPQPTNHPYKVVNSTSLRTALFLPIATTGPKSGLILWAKTNYSHFRWTTSVKFT